MTLKRRSWLIIAISVSGGDLCAKWLKGTWRAVERRSINPRVEHFASVAKKAISRFFRFAFASSPSQSLDDVIFRPEIRKNVFNKLFPERTQSWEEKQKPPQVWQHRTLHPTTSFDFLAILNGKKHLKIIFFLKAITRNCCFWSRSRPIEWFHSLLKYLRSDVWFAICAINPKRKWKIKKMFFKFYFSRFENSFATNEIWSSLSVIYCWRCLFVA